MTAELIVPAFVAGILTFLAPCTLPLVPGYLGFISGVSFEELANPARVRAMRRRVLANGAAFVAGFSVVFIAFGLLAGTMGMAIAGAFGLAVSDVRIWLGRIGGVFVILFGLSMLGAIRLPLFRDRAASLPAAFRPGSRPNSAILGATFALGWSPCVGPVLGSVLLVAATSGAAFSGALLLAVFSLGLALPFLAVALGVGTASRVIARYSWLLGAASVVGGLFLVAVGTLMVADRFNYLVLYGYRWFRFLEYDALLRYL